MSFRIMVVRNTGRIEIGGSNSIAENRRVGMGCLGHCGQKNKMEGACREQNSRCYHREFWFRRSKLQLGNGIVLETLFPECVVADDN
jgi:hypothetical protein